MRNYILNNFLLTGCLSVLLCNPLLANSTDNVDRKVSRAVTDSCGRVSISGSNPINISSSGTYCLDSDASSITIAADYIDLDLGGHKVFNITSSSNNHVQILNGSITGNIQVTNGADINLSNLVVDGIGVQCTGTQRLSIINCTVSNASTGFNLSNVVRGQLSNCVAIHNKINGFFLNGCQDTVLVGCKSLDNGFGVGNIIPASYTYGFISQNGARNALYDCQANGITSNSTLFASVCAGFALLGSESGTIISDSVSMFNGRAMASGYAYGILLQSSFPIDNSSKLFQYTTQNQGQGCYALAWSPDGKYLAIGGLRHISLNADIQVFKFDPAQPNPWTKTAVLQQGGGCFSLAWSPNGKYLATGGYAQNTTSVPNSEEIQVFSFNPNLPNAFTRIAAQNQGQSAQKPQCTSVAWSQDGKYLATGGLPQNGVDLQVFSFDPAQAAPLNRMAGQIQGGQCSALSWSPNGQYLATAGKPQNGLTVQIFSFDGTNASNGLSLTPVGTQQLGVEAKAINFAPSGKYIAAAGNNGANGSEVHVYNFDPAQTNAIATRIGVQTQNYSNALAWSADEKYFVVSSKTQTSPWVNNIQVFKFDPNQQNAFGLYAMQLQGAESYACAWSPDGRYIATGSDISNSTAVKVYTALQFPVGNIIVNNKVIGTSNSAAKPNGVSIYGSSIVNLIANNQAFNNITDYVFVLNTSNSSLKN